MKINILIPYEESEKFYEKWAHEEDKIDFLKDLYEAKRCTIAFAAEELCTYLKKMGHEAKVSDKEGNFNIIIDAKDGENEEFDIESDEKNIRLSGWGRAGALYAVYEFLEVQGVRWYAPKLEYVPTYDRDLIIPENKHYKYDMEGGRGFHFEGLQKESLSFLLWMARNRMNLHACHVHAKKFQQKLCMKFFTGGHIFEKILNPLNIEKDGRYYIDAHPDWYGKQEEKLTVENALKTQFCASNEELLDRLADTIIERANNEWKNEEIFELAGFDTWGKSCACEKCRNLGNGSDITLHFISHIRKRLDEAYETGKINRKVLLSFAAYEGTDTIKAPLNPVPENIIKAGDILVFAPILRCFKHYFDDTSCDRNRRYKEYLEAWSKVGVPITINEYYNVSKFEDLPLVFTKKIYNDVRYYKNNGVTRLFYMHVPMVEWGVCTTTQYLLANITRDSNCRYFELLDEYYKNIFGEYADEVKVVYENLEKAGELCSSWRGWFGTSILTNLIEWDGKLPKSSIYRDSDLGDDLIEKGYNSVRLLKEALKKMRDIKEREIENLPKYGFLEADEVLNPIEQQKKKSQTILLDKLCEDIRGISYGVNMQELLVLMLDYHETLYAGEIEKARTLFEKFKSLGSEMSETTNGVSFMAYIPDFEVRDVLKRSQLKDTYYRCLANKGILEKE